MRRFTFDIKAKKQFSTEENGWTYKMNCLNKIGFFYLKSPVMKEITYSKGETIRYRRHTVFGIGYVDDNFVFKGVALFDLFERVLIVLLLLLGVSYASGDIYIGFLGACMFYLLFTYLSREDDDSLLHRAGIMC